MTIQHQDASPVGIVIAARNRSPALAEALSHLLTLPERPEILVVDNASTDDTRAMLARDFPRVRVLALPFNHGALARNYGARALDTPSPACACWNRPSALRRPAATRADQRRGLSSRTTGTAAGTGRTAWAAR
ncbi:glycosyltransferase family 2 protein [Streptomyces chartreusis]|uniref:glycosyltransferase family 2 protein n=1 Tax=Streptomyces chartreusis TaxID=1969 RepID=UPI003F5417E0